MSDDTFQISESVPIPAVVQNTGFRLAEFGWILLGGLLMVLLIALGESGVLPPVLDILVKILRLPLGLAYVLFVPGYCLTAALFPGADDIDGIERTGLSLGLSIAWVPVIALILDRLPWGLFLWPIVAGQLISIVVFVAVAIYRRAHLPAGEAYAPPRWRPGPWWRGQPAADRRIYKICAGALLLAGLALAWVFLVPSPDEFMTEFYILGPEGLAENYPREVAAGEPLAVSMGVANKERDSMTYTVKVWAVDPWDEKRRLVGAAGPITLNPGLSVEQDVQWSMPWPGDDQIVEFYLYAKDKEGNIVQPDDTNGRGGLQTAQPPYRQLRLWLNVTE